MLSRAHAEQPADDSSGPVEDDEEDDDELTLAALAEAVVSQIPDAAKHRGDLSYVAAAAGSDGVKTVAGMVDWISRKSLLAERSGFRPKNPRYFPESQIETLGKYLRAVR